MLWSGRGVTEDEAKAASIVSPALVSKVRAQCESGDGRACSPLGTIHDHGIGVPKDRTKAVKVYEKGCDVGNAWSCSRLGDLHEAGQGVPKDLTKAAKFHDKACELGDGNVCFSVGRLYESGQASLEGLGEDQALQRYERACELGTEAGCIHALRLYEEACEAGDAAACHRVGSLYVRGPYPWKAVDGYQALKFYEKACALGQEEGCTQALYWAEKDCEAGNGPSCSTLADRHQTGQGVPKDPAKALVFHEKACELSQEAGCTKVLEADEEACEAGDAAACYGLGTKYENGQGAPKDPARALKFHEKACETGVLPACLGLALKYESGQGARKDPARALMLFEKACVWGLYDACSRLPASFFKRRVFNGTTSRYTPSEEHAVGYIEVTLVSSTGGQTAYIGMLDILLPCAVSVDTRVTLTVEKGLAQFKCSPPPGASRAAPSATVNYSGLLSDFMGGSEFHRDWVEVILSKVGPPRATSEGDGPVSSESDELYTELDDLYWPCDLEGDSRFTIQVTSTGTRIRCD
jgi:TPR repeat protein